MQGAAKYIEALLRDNIYYYTSYTPISMVLRKRASMIRILNVPEAFEFCNVMWPNITESEIKQSLKLLVESKVLKCKPNGSFEVLIERKVPVDVLVHGYSRYKYDPKDKPGKCYKCGQYVKYSNRHSRANSGHTGEDCLLNQIASVMNV